MDRLLDLQSLHPRIESPPRLPRDMKQALEGVKILDLSRVLAGPYAAQNLADLGADVLKIEAPWGDDTRGWGPPFTTGFDGEDVAAYFLSCNRGKTIVRMNLKQDGKKLQDLVAQADVVVENFRPGTFDRLVGELPDDTILCSISGYGATGPRSSEPGYDLSLQARSGIMSITGEEGRPPVKVGVAWIDVITGLYATSAILAALFHRERTGMCQRIDISLWDCAISALVNQAQNRISSGKEPQPMGSAHPNLVPYRAFEASDGWFVLAVGSDTQWQQMAQVLEIDSPKSWSTNSGRVEDRIAVERVLSRIFLNDTRSHWENLLEGIPCAPVNTIGQALHDVQSVARDVLWNVRGVQTLANPLRGMSLTPAKPGRANQTSFNIDT